MRGDYLFLSVSEKENTEEGSLAVSSYRNGREVKSGRKRDGRTCWRLSATEKGGGRRRGPRKKKGGFPFAQVTKKEKSRAKTLSDLKQKLKSGPVIDS